MFILLILQPKKKKKKKKKFGKNRYTVYKIETRSLYDLANNN